MRHLDLFSGIGGFALAASWVWGAEHEIVSFCEIEPYPQKVLKKHWPDVPCHGDIKTLKGDSFGTIDLITGGFPCQPFSVAGKQGGSSDDRHLWPEMFRVIQEAKPTWIIGENVANIRNMVEFREILLDLESANYELQVFNIPAHGVGGLHRRERMWIVGNSKDNRLKHTINATREIIHKENIPREEIPTKGNLACNQGKFLQKVRTSKFIRKSNGISGRVDRIKGLGNSIVPQCVVPIMQSIRATELTTKTTTKTTGVILK